MAASGASPPTRSKEAEAAWLAAAEANANVAAQAAAAAQAGENGGEDVTMEGDEDEPEGGHA